MTTLTRAKLRRFWDAALSRMEDGEEATVWMKDLAGYWYT